MLDEYPDYHYENGVVTRLKDSKVIQRGSRGYWKLKNKEGKWKTCPLSTLQTLAGEVTKITPDFKKIPYTNGKYFINPKGVIYSFAFTNPLGRILSPMKGSRGYPKVTLTYKGKRRGIEIHQLMCATFILEDYVERGLVCLHKDDDKLNFALSNLSVGTYSQNNKDAYSTGVNRGNGLKK